MVLSIDERIRLRSILEKLNKKHHSTSDWDFTNAYWSLNTARYISPPSSLRVNSTADFFAGCRDSNTINIKEGRLECGLNFPTTTYARSGGFCFRSQTAVGTPPIASTCYRVYVNNATKYIYCYKGTTSLGTKEEPADQPADTWVLKRVTFWKSGTPLYIRWERFDGVNWVQDFDDWIDDTPFGDGTSTNRCGIYCKMGSTAYAIHFDDTVIYARV